MVAVREINLEGLPDSQRNWLNDHTVYTHGYGFYAAYGNQRTTEGDPVFFEGGGRSAPSGSTSRAIYFGELSPTYSVVGAEAGAPPREFDYPAGGEGDVAVQQHLLRQRRGRRSARPCASSPTRSSTARPTSCSRMP